MSERSEYARDTVLAVRLSRAERSRLGAEARRGGVPLSTFVRQAALLRLDEAPGLATRTAEVVYARHTHDPAQVEVVMGAPVAPAVATSPAQALSAERTRGALLRQQLAGGKGR